jgi:DNA-binding cell septation regulator SpoVG
MEDIVTTSSGDSSQHSKSILVLGVRPSPKIGAVKAYADVQYHGATIKGLSIVQHAGGYFVGFPSNLGKNGKRFAIVEFPEPVRGQIAKLVLEAAKDLL